MPEIPRAARYLLLAVAAFTVVVCLLFALTDCPFDYLEGVLYDAARRILAGDSLYCDIATTTPCVLLPHTPIYVGLVAGAGKIFGLSLALGRLFSVASLAVSLLMLYWIARRHTPPRLAVAAPLAFLVFAEVGFYFGIMRPEPLSLALGLAALALFLRTSTWRGTAVAALLFVVAVLAKPNHVAMPLAICLHLLAVDRRRLVVFVATGAMGAAGAVALLQVLTGGHFLDNHVLAHSSRAFSGQLLLQILFYGALPWTLVLLGGLAIAVRSVARGSRELEPLLFVVAFVWCLSSAALQGSAAYYYLELYAATALALVHWAGGDAASRRGTSARFARMVRWAVCVQIAVAAVVNPIIEIERYTSLRRSWTHVDQLRAIVRSAPGWVFSEDAILGALGERPLLAETFMNAHLARAGLWDEAPYLAALGDGRISTVVLREAPIEKTSGLQRERLTPRMIELIARNYRLQWSDGRWYVYRFKREPAPG